ncbi:hypothetical protein Sme01_46860 [Sphaerisporangium melleum]|uniref:DUF4037 domain-containing protein n=1 Tax=Sphaerisporangium melleum TaxID=321316 RepID=A0A917RED3_9ACTN|nr:DUF4037 domain-containing protein [Sphaerisporangium melleum]GGL02094.1 hypothetical protein GCM10007964_50270 [Sphaerisporangium melleum]GII72210.1 hypothetical protein Sme01_46860 [Sphaerisporangium melleum]
MSDFASGFVPGLELSRTFYTEVVRPLIGEVPHSAALIGPGSEVLAFDTERSADHDWGPRVLVFVEPGQEAGLTQRLAYALPARFRGYPTVFGSDRNPPRHGVVVTGFGRFARSRLGFDPRRPISTADWLGVSWQRLAEMTSGEVFHDGLGELATARANLRWYPDQVWRYVLASQWRRVAELESFPGRCAEVGDDLGSLLVTARLVEELMRLCLLMRRRYPPYAKWLGSAFARLGGSAELGEAFSAALAARDWHAREEHLCRAYQRVASLHNRLALTEPLDTSVRGYHDRPFRVIGAARFAEALLDTVGPPLRDLPATGSVDQFCDGVALLGDSTRSLAVSRTVHGA